MAERKSPLEFWEDDHGGWHWILHTSGDPFASPGHFPNRPAAVNNFLLLITLGNAEIARTLQSGDMFPEDG